MYYRAFSILLLLLAMSLVNIANAGADDTNEKEVGVEWVNDYSAARAAGYPLSDLSYADDEAIAFYNYLGNVGFTKVFNYGNSWAWESDFEKTAVGGGDYLYADNVDIVYFAGHGSPNTFWFGVNKDGDGAYPFRVHSSEASWGDKDLEWIIIQSCRVLEYAYRLNWNQVFEGFHGINSFHTTAYVFSDGRQGYWFAYFATTGGLSTGAAWREATILVQPSDVYAAIYRAAIRIDTFVVDYYDEPLGASWNDYGDGYVYLYGIRYDSWQC